MNKEFIPYEQALELKQLGFDEPCLSYYEGESFSYHLASIKGDDYIIPAPLFQQAFRWFREKYDMHYSIDKECSQHDKKWGYNWSLYNYTGIFNEYLTSHPDAPAGEWVYETHEEAELTCLKKLIEIVKNK
jgi:hypothetical protein